MTSSRRPSIVCASTADWDAPLWTNKQHLMSRLAAAGETVLYIDSLGLRRPGATKQDGRRIVRRLAVWRPWAEAVEGRLLRDSPLVIPLHSEAFVRRVNRQLLRWRLRRNERRWRLVRPVLWAYTPTAVDLFDPRRHGGLVYHCVDDLAAFPGVDSNSFAAMERRLVEAADVCIVSSRVLESKISALGPRQLEYWPNPADTTAIRAVPTREPDNEDVVVGFVGAVQSHKVDMELMQRCAEFRPGWRFLLAGPVGLGLGSTDSSTARFPANVTLLGAVHRNDIPALLATFSVGIIPYRVNAYNASVFPMKVFEYLAAGLPVVSTPLPSLIGEVENVIYAESAERFIEEIESALAADTPEAAEARASYASKFSWENRTSQAMDLLRRLRRPPSAPGRP